MSHQPRFNAYLVAAIQEGLDSIGPSISHIVLFHLQRNNSVRFDQPSVDAEALDDGLKEIFGFGAKVIERRILEVLYVKLEVNIQLSDNFEFTEEVRKAHKLLNVSNPVRVET